jgi:hypothetical protein
VKSDTPALLRLDAQTHLNVREEEMYGRQTALALGVENIALALAAQASLTHNPAPVPVLRLATNRSASSHPGEDHERQLAARYGKNWIMTAPF